HQSLITDVLQFRLHPYAIIIMNSVRLGGRFLAPKALTTDIRAMCRLHILTKILLAAIERD
ncbi:hypothetical protein ACXHXM_32200, partial